MHNVCVAEWRRKLTVLVRNSDRSNYLLADALLRFNARVMHIYDLEKKSGHLPENILSILLFHFSSSCWFASLKTNQCDDN
jgi:hypothetical protein